MIAHALSTAIGPLLVVAGVGGASAQPATRPAGLQEVILVFKTHYDIGYTASAHDVVETYRTSMIDKALDVCDATRSLPAGQRFVWTIPGWPMTQMLGPQQTPQRRERILAALREGQLVFHALPFTTSTESLELEDVVRGMRYSTGLATSLGQALPRDAKMTDVPSHVWCLPTILARAGVEFLFIGVNRVCVPPDVPLLFWWEGPDGSRVLTMLVDAYGTGQIPPRDIGGFGTGLVPPKDWPYKTWLAMIHTSDNEGPPKLAQVQELLESAANELPGVRVRVGRLADFADAIRGENATLPIVRADMPDTWIHGIMSMPVETKLARDVRPAIGTLESLDALLRAWGVRRPDLRQTIDEAREKSLLFGEHTWGMNVKRFGPRLYGDAWKAAYDAGKYAKLEESFEEHGAYIHDVERLIRPALDARLKALAGAIAIEGPRIVVFNPLPWTRDDVVEVSAGTRAPRSVRDVVTDRLEPVDNSGGAIRFIARGVPPLGYRTYVFTEMPAPSAIAGVVVDEATATLENGLLRVQLDPHHGTIRSLIDMRSGRELAGDSDEARFGQYLYERFGRQDVQRYLDAYTRVKTASAEGDFGKPGLPAASQMARTAACPVGFKMSIVKGLVGTTVTMSAPPSDRVPHAVSLSVTLYAGQPYADLEWSVRNKSPDPWPEAGWLCLPVACKPSFRIGRLGAIIDPCKDIQPNTNHDVLCVNAGLTVGDPDGGGLGICPIDSPLVSLGRPGLWRFSREYIPQRPFVFVNLYNNQWPTNYPQWIGGSWTSRVRVWPVAKTDSTSGLVQPAWEARMRCLSAAASGPARSLPPTQAGVVLSRGGVLVTALGPNPDGAGILLRLWEQAGEDGDCRVELPARLTGERVQTCDLRGRAVGEPIPVERGAFTIRLTHFAPVSLLLTGTSGDGE